MANYMKDVAKMLGVELGEEFLCSDGHNYVLETYGLACTDFKHQEHSIVFGTRDKLSPILTGTYTIKKKPWKPHYREEYYSIGPGGVLEPGRWLNDFIDVAMYKLGNCYRTPQEAEANRDKWIAFYASDEMLEVNNYGNY